MVYIKNTILYAVIDCPVLLLDQALQLCNR